jgi:uncharacterized protein (DUF2344 family)
MNVESKEEFLDFFTYRYIHPDDCLRQLNSALPAEVQFIRITQISKNAPSLSSIINGAEYSFDLSSPALQPVLRNFASMHEIDFNDCHRYAIDLFLEKPEVLITKHKTEKVVNIKNFVQHLHWDSALSRLFVEMKIIDGSTVGIQHVARALYETNVEFPSITRESQFVKRDGVNLSPLDVESDALQAAKIFIDQI